MAQSQVTEHLRTVPSQLWWSDKGRKMKVEKLDLKFGMLRISNDAIAMIKISRPNISHTTWKLYWRVMHSTGRAEGNVFLENASLLAVAFGLQGNRQIKSDTFILDQYEGDVAIQGIFIRHGDRLNVPGPGLPWQGGATVSIRLDSDIQNAVHALLSS